MATLFSKVISDSRVDLNDTGSTRYTDAQLIGYANDGVREIKKARPDLFFGSYSSALSTYVSTDNVPFDDLYVAFLKDYVTFRAGLRDDEENSAQRSVAFFNRFKGGLQSA
jgi:hypothetical protein